MVIDLSTQEGREELLRLREEELAHLSTEEREILDRMEDELNRGLARAFLFGDGA